MGVSGCRSVASNPLRWIEKDEWSGEGADLEGRFDFYLNDRAIELTLPLVFVTDGGRDWRYARDTAVHGVARPYGELVKIRIFPWLHTHVQRVKVTEKLLFLFLDTWHKRKSDWRLAVSPRSATRLGPLSVVGAGQFMLANAFFKRNGSPLAELFHTQRAEVQ